MKGLFLKDIFNLKQQGKIYLVIIAVWMIIGIFNKDPFFFTGVMMIFSLLIPISALAYDEKAKWDRYALTMPVSRTDMVVAKYLLSLACTLLGGLFSTAFGILLSGEVKDMVLSTMTMISLGVVLASLVFPFMFKFGVEKARMIMMIVFIVPTLLGVLISKTNIPMPSEDFIGKALCFLPIIAFIVILVSIFISISVYKRKEF